MSYVTPHNTKKNTTRHDTTRPTQVDATTATILWARALPVMAAHVALDNFGGIFVGGSYSQVRCVAEVSFRLVCVVVDVSCQKGLLGL